jgi:hydrophobic/amphiphilic exporter-1 (mainly G- bacteria), HAE1 family
LQVIPDRERLAEVGLSEAEVGAMVEAALGGRFASQFIDGKEELDVTVQLQNVFVKTPEQLRQLSLYSARIPQNTTPTSGNTSATTSATTPTAAGGQLQLSDVATVKETIGPGVINHVDLERSHPHRQPDSSRTAKPKPKSSPPYAPNSHQNFG